MVDNRRFLLHQQIKNSTRLMRREVDCCELFQSGGVRQRLKSWRGVAEDTEKVWRKLVESAKKLNLADKKLNLNDTFN